MPTMPRQPGSVKGCADSGKKTAKVTPEAAWPEGVAPQDGDQTPIQQAWPSGISET